MKPVRARHKTPARRRIERPVYPFAAIVGQEEMKLALLLNVIDSRVGGVAFMGHRGTGKSTAVRALADLLPLAWRVRGCLYGCDPEDEANFCVDCMKRVLVGGKLARERAPVPVVDLPLGATEDRVCGTISIERALTEGVKAFEPGLLARVNRGFLYIDEVNLLEDHLVDLLLDVAATGRNTVERESISVEHPARFVLVGSGNPEEGELRPQLLDRFGLYVEITTTGEFEERLMIVERRDAFERNPAEFCAAWESAQQSLRRRILRARRNVHKVLIERSTLRRIAELCVELKVDGHRGELTIARAARALAAFESRRKVTDQDVRRVAVMSLRHRLRRDPLDQTPGGKRIEQALEKSLPESDDGELVRAHGGNDRDDFAPDDLRESRNAANSFESRPGGNNGEVKSDGREQDAPPESGARLPNELLNLPADGARAGKAQPSESSRRQQGTRRASSNRLRGRYARAVAGEPAPGARLALDATLRAVATLAVKSRTTGVDKRVAIKASGTRSPLIIAPDALRFKLFKRKKGTLFIFAIDTSGSMALNRIRQAKGALANLLEQSYVRRDHVALVSFRAECAEIILSPSQSVARARRLLDSLPVGGTTPLASALAASLEIAVRARRQGTGRIVLLLFTDGRANVALHADGASEKSARRRLIQAELQQLGALLKSAHVVSVVADTESRFTSNGEARTLATTLGSRYIYLSSEGGP